MDFTQIMSSNWMLNGSLIPNSSLLGQKLERVLMPKYSRASKFANLLKLQLCGHRNANLHLDFLATTCIYLHLDE